MTDTFAGLLKAAQRLSKRSACAFKHGAIVARQKRVYGRGVNDNRSHPTWGSPKCSEKTLRPMYTLHAEAAAIRDATNRGHDLKGATIYVARHNGLCSRPCAFCYRLIKKHGISRIIYTNGPLGVGEERLSKSGTRRRCQEDHETRTADGHY